ncbi:c-type cytochrome [Methylococcus capsulatus]|uniref:c-type cytochrome n=1 Tax=Methylococcus capsulatus TaxID=414 RepID=UPI0012B5D56A|nr:c-type cytochrome [Methylococcus capsulatus]
MPRRTMGLALYSALGALLCGYAQASEELAKAKNCVMCHSVDKKILGPAFKDVAQKYAGQQGADVKLAEKVMKGGSGVWGTMVMPPNPQVSETEAKQLVQWILSLK